MMKGLLVPRNYTILGLLYVGCLLLFTRNSVLLSHAWGNAGLILLNHSLTRSQSGANSQQSLVNAEARLRRATDLMEENYRAWRGLGFALAFQSKEEAALSAWQTTGEMTDEYIQWGHLARNANQLDDALTWYTRATWVAPEQGDIWYYKGIVLQGLQRWDDAFAAHDRALKSSYFSYAGISDVYFQKGMIYQWSPDYQDLDEALQMYDEALRINSFSSTGAKAWTYYRRAEIYSWQGRDPRLSIAEYKQALAVWPGHYWARLFLGEALYRAYQDVTLAEAEIRQAIAFWPAGDKNQKAPYRYLGDIYQDAGLTEKAIAAYTEALRLDPDDEYIREALTTLLKE